MPLYTCHHGCQNRTFTVKPQWSAHLENEHKHKWECLICGNISSHHKGYQRHISESGHKHPREDEEAHIALGIVKVPKGKEIRTNGPRSGDGRVSEKMAVEKKLEGGKTDEVEKGASSKKNVGKSTGKSAEKHQRSLSPELDKTDVRRSRLARSVVDKFQRAPIALATTQHSTLRQTQKLPSFKKAPKAPIAEMGQEPGSSSTGARTPAPSRTAAGPQKEKGNEHVFVRANNQPQIPGGLPHPSQVLPESKLARNPFERKFQRASMGSASMLTTAANKKRPPPPHEHDKRPQKRTPPADNPSTSIRLQPGETSIKASALKLVHNASIRTGWETANKKRQRTEPTPTAEPEMPKKEPAGKVRRTEGYNRSQMYTSKDNSKTLGENHVVKTESQIEKAEDIKPSAKVLDPAAITSTPEQQLPQAYLDQFLLQQRDVEIARLEVEEAEIALRQKQVQLRKTMLGLQ